MSSVIYQVQSYEDLGLYNRAFSTKELAIAAGAQRIKECYNTQAILEEGWLHEYDCFIVKLFLD